MMKNCSVQMQTYAQAIGLIHETNNEKFRLYLTDVLLGSPAGDRK